MSSERSGKRKYELRQRAEEMARTRRRITEAAVELHGSVGPARTTISAIAQRAGVQRHTVYRHFPAEADLYTACSSHYLTENPWPDPEPWRAISDPRQRLTRALDELYRWYEATEPMFSNVLRDLELVDALQPTIVPLQDYLAEAAEILAAGWPIRARRRRLLAAALRHVLDFHTWGSLAAANQLTQTEAVQLATALVEGATAPKDGAAAPQHRATAPQRRATAPQRRATA